MKKTMDQKRQLTVSAFGITKKTGVFIKLFLALLLTGCASQQDVLYLESRIVALEKQNRQLAEETDRVRSEKALLEGRLQDYTQSVEEADESLRSQSAGLRAISDRIRNEIGALRGKIEEIDFRLTQRIRELSDTQTDIAGRITRLEESFGMGAQNDSGAAAIPATGDGRRLSEDELYSLAKRAFDAGNFDVARDGFNRLLSEYPKANQADNAKFWIGEIYFRQNDFENAILAYQEVIERYPNGNKVPSSLLKQGMAFVRIANPAAARDAFEDLIRRFPNSSEASIAQKKLEDL